MMSEKLDLNKSSGNRIVFISALHSSFRDFIANIFKRCAEKQMSRILAGRIITGVTHEHSLWNLAVKQGVAETMSSVILSPGLKETIATPSATFTPFPAFRFFPFSKACQILHYWGLSWKQLKSAVSFQMGVVGGTHLQSYFSALFTIGNGAGFHPSYNKQGIPSCQFYYG